MRPGVNIARFPVPVPAESKVCTYEIHILLNNKFWFQTKMGDAHLDKTRPTGETRT
jgi:hypothetical protein